MKRIYSYILVLLLASACTSNIEELNIDIKHPSAGTVPSATVFATSEANLFEQIVNTNVNRNVFRLFAQQWTETTYLDESNYDIVSRAIADAHWLQMYVRVLNNLKEAKSLVSAEVPLSDADKIAQKNKLAAIELLSIYSYQVLVDSFGNVPYAESLAPSNVNPKYDDAKAIYTDLAKRLDAALASINTSGGSFGSGDLVYGGDMAKWKKFGNFLKLKMGLTLADSDASTAKTMIEAAFTNGLPASNGDNTTLKYGGDVPNTNPIWLDLVQSGRHDFVPANTIVDIMNAVEDPRRAVYFTKLNDAYIGGPYAGGGNYTNFSQIGDKFNDPTLEGVLMDYAEVEFSLAESAARGFNVGGTAEAHYNKAISASIAYWGGSDDDAKTYLANPKVAYTTATGSFKQKIGTQKWLALYNRGFEAWTEWRRLDYPVFNPPAGKTYADIPVRFTYPIKEQTLNGANYKAASAAIGNDKLSTKLFWDKF
ncbi:Starch-binding associating with outer membrane [Pseudarcicella hirudinis]|uniref:Starch-binding associating with outer membrane n=1 Tax=Pseudarcicella hirudinis TaxID=1079859 RepID=A0A1I5P2I1_9BACT|nr:SusD/RagB family nutrient-binding outer membrane lipoprotein [Pseudarcicella hirudinis]SFP27751.1 Starch-binding associating with outer membrane [Pseudarcicella hirudinis]